MVAFTIKNKGYIYIDFNTFLRFRYSHGIRDSQLSFRGYGDTNIFF